MAVHDLRRPLRVEREEVEGRARLARGVVGAAQAVFQEGAQELAARPTEWMPWNYRETLARTVNLPDPA